MSGDGDRGREQGNELGIPGLADLERFAVGSSGIVYRAEDVRHGRTVAVKVLGRRGIDAETELALERELAAMGRLSTHPNIIDLYGSGTTVDRQPYIMMPYYHRGNYADLVDESGPLPWREVLDFGIKIAGALHTAHTRGFVHRDIKPANIFRGEFDRQPILADFGIASFAAPGVGGSFTVKVSTTPLYGAPEVLEGERPTERSDIYSFGASLFALVEGQPAFTDPSTEVVVHRVTAAKTPPRPTAPVPEEFAELLGEMMARNPDRRPATCLRVAHRLVEIQKANGIDPTPIVSDEAGVADSPIEPTARLPAVDVAGGVAVDGVSVEEAATVEAFVPEVRGTPRIELIGGHAPVPAPSSTRPVESLDRPTEPAADLPTPRRPGTTGMPRVRPALRWALLAAGLLLIAATAYTRVNGSGPNPAELLDRNADQGAAAALRAAWGDAGEPTLMWPAHPSSWVTDVAFAPAGPDLATSGTDGAVRIWPGSPTDEAAAEFEFAEWVIDVDWSPDGRRLAVAATDGTVAIASAAGGQPTVLDRRGSSAEAVAWDPSGTRLLIGYAGGQVVVRSVGDRGSSDTGAATTTGTVLEGHDGDVLDLEWAPNGDRAVSSAKDGRVIVWDLNANVPVVVIENPDGIWTRAVQWGAATIFLTTDDDGAVTFRSIVADDDTTEELSQIDIGGTVIASDLWIGSGVLLVAAYEDGSIRVWDLVTGEEAFDLLPSENGDGAETDDATAISWSNDGRALAVGRRDGSVQIWSLD